MLMKNIFEAGLIPTFEVPEKLRISMTPHLHQAKGTKSFTAILNHMVSEKKRT